MSELNEKKSEESRKVNMTFEQAKQIVVRCSGMGIRRPCWKDKTLRITGDKQFAGARTVHKGNEREALIELAKDLRHKQETVYDGSDLFFCSDAEEYSDGGVYNGMPLKLGNWTIPQLVYKVKQLSLNNNH